MGASLAAGLGSRRPRQSRNFLQCSTGRWIPRLRPRFNRQRQGHENLPSKNFAEKCEHRFDTHTSPHSSVCASQQQVMRRSRNVPWRSRVGISSASFRGILTSTQKLNMKKSMIRLVGSLAVAATCVTGAMQPQRAQASEGPTIVEAALAVNAETGEFSTLIAAVVRAGLVDTLNGKRQFTVFAPTDAAFAKLGLNAGNIDTVPLDALTNILLYHVAP